MNRPTGLLMLGLCCVLTVAAGGCRSGEQTLVEPEPQPETLTDPPSPPTSETVTPEAVTPEASPTASPRPTPGPEGGQGTPINPPQAAQLIAGQPESQINLRTGPSTSSAAKGYGLVGDPVQLLRSTQASDGTWYYVKFEKSGAEGWIRGDFINIEGRAQALGDRATQSRQCKGLLESLTFTAFYDANGFHLVRFTNLETKSTFDSPLSRQGSNAQGQPLYTGTANPPTGGIYAVQLTDESGGNPGNGSAIELEYSALEATGTCK